MASPDSTISQIAMPIPREPSLFNQKCGCTVSEAAQPWKPCRKTTRKIQHKKNKRFCYGHLMKKLTCPGHSDRTHWQKEGHCRVPHLHQGEHKVHNFNTFPLRFKRGKKWIGSHYMSFFECEFPKSFPAWVRETVQGTWCVFTSWTAFGTMGVGLHEKFENEEYCTWTPI